VCCRGLLIELCSMNTGDADFARSPGAVAAFARGLAEGCIAVLEIGARLADD
jgi:hypothetical protein